MAQKTREKLIDVARQLFARKGLAHTTMDDIAAAAEKGRRTIYTYFKSKRDIYIAVVERESDRHVEKLRAVADNMSLSPEKQLYEFLLTRYTAGFDPASRSFFAKLSLDVRRSDRFRQLVYAKELQLLDMILARGLNEHVFDPEQTSRLRSFMHQWLLTVDWATAPYGLPESAADSPMNLIEFIVKGTLIK